MSEILSTVSLISYILSAVFALTAIFIGIRFNIPSVIGDLSGRTARKAIEKMYNGKRNSTPSYMPARKTVNVKKKTQPITAKLPHVTAKIPKNKVSEETEEVKTGILIENKGEYDLSLHTALMETADASDGVDHITVPLGENATPEARSKRRERLVMIDEVIMIHTDKTIS